MNKKKGIKFKICYREKKINGTRFFMYNKFYMIGIFLSDTQLHYES